MINITAIDIECGVITLIEPNGIINVYRQRGIGSLSYEETCHEIRSGRLNPQWRKFKELPRNYHIEFEDEQIMGKAVATYWLALKKLKDKRRAKYNK